MKVCTVTSADSHCPQPLLPQGSFICLLEVTLESLCACPIPCAADGPGVCMKILVVQVPLTQKNLGHGITLLRNKKIFPTALLMQPL